MLTGWFPITVHELRRRAYLARLPLPIPLREEPRDYTLPATDDAREIHRGGYEAG